MLRQFRAVTGRRFRRPYLDEINAQVPYLGQKEAAQQRLMNEEFRRKMLKKELELKEEATKEEKENQKLANIMGGIKTGFDVGTGLYNAFSGDGLNKTTKSEQEPIIEQKEQLPTEDQQMQQDDRFDVNKYLNQDKNYNSNFGDDVWDFSLNESSDSGGGGGK